MRQSVLLVTGGAGFIGSNFVHHVLAHTDDRIVVVDKLTYAGSLLNLEDALSDPRLTFVRADIADRSAMAQVFRESAPDAVVNLAAETHVDRSIDDPAPFVDTNVVGTFVLLETARRALSGRDRSARDRFRFLHVSTDEVYGAQAPGGAASEQTPYAPASPYAASKASADHLVQAFGSTYGLGVLLTNCSNNYGPFQFPEKLIPLMALNALEGRPLPVYGDGRHVRDWLHVDDHAAGLLLVLRRGRTGEKYNIGGGAERTNLEVVEQVCQVLEACQPAADNPALKPRGTVSYAALRTFVAERPGHDRRYAIDARKIRRELGWQPRRNFEEGLRETVRWYVEHPAWCQAVQVGRYDRERLGLVPTHVEGRGR